MRGYVTHARSAGNRVNGACPCRPGRVQFACLPRRRTCCARSADRKAVESFGGLLGELRPPSGSAANKQRRLVAGAMARLLGDGGIAAVAAVSAMSRNTVIARTKVVDSGEAPMGRVRAEGAGRPQRWPIRRSGPISRASPSPGPEATRCRRCAGRSSRPTSTWQPSTFWLSRPYGAHAEVFTTALEFRCGPACAARARTDASGRSSPDRASACDGDGRRRSSISSSRRARFCVRSNLWR